MGRACQGQRGDGRDKAQRCSDPCVAGISLRGVIISLWAPRCCSRIEMYTQATAWIAKRGNRFPGASSSGGERAAHALEGVGIPLKLGRMRRALE